MKKSIIKYLFLFSFLLILPIFSNVNAETIDTVITGNVSHDGTDIIGADVTVVCNSNVRNTTTNSSGDYLVTYPISQCAQGDNASVTATSPEGYGSNQAVVQHFVAGPGLELDIAIINISLPEFGLITGAITAVGAGITYLGLKRKISN